MLAPRATFPNLVTVLTHGLIVLKNWICTFELIVNILPSCTVLGNVTSVKKLTGAGSDVGATSNLVLVAAIVSATLADGFVIWYALVMSASSIYPLMPIFATDTLLSV